MAGNYSASNNAYTKLSSSITQTQTSIEVVDVSILPPVPFLLTIFKPGDPEINEIILVTGVSGNTLTVTRGIEDTTPLAWDADTDVENRFTAGMYKDLYEFKGTGGRYYNRVDPVTNAFQLVWEED